MGQENGGEGRKRQRRLRAPVRRELILDGALRVFADRGYNAAMEDVAKAAGLTRTVLYYYAPSKKDLFLEVAEAQATVLLRYVAPAMAKDGSLVDRMRATIDATLQFAEHEPLAWRLLFRQLEGDEPNLLEVRTRVHDTVIAAASAFMQSDIDTLGVDPKSSRGRLVAELLVGATTAAGIWWTDHPSGSREDVLDTITDLLWRGLSGMAKAPPVRATKRPAASRRPASGRIG